MPNILYEEYVKALSYYERALFLSNLSKKDLENLQQISNKATNDATDIVGAVESLVVDKEKLSSYKNRIAVANIAAEYSLKRAALLKQEADKMASLLRGNDALNDYLNYHKHWILKKDPPKSPLDDIVSKFFSVKHIDRCRLITSLYLDAQLHQQFYYEHLFQTYSILLDDLSSGLLGKKISTRVWSYQPAEPILYWRKKIDESFDKLLKQVKTATKRPKGDAIVEECQAYWVRLGNICDLYNNEIARFNDRIDSMNATLDNRSNLRWAIYGIFASAFFGVGSLLISIKQEWLDPKGNSAETSNKQIQGQIQKPDSGEINKIADKKDSLNKSVANLASTNTNAVGFPSTNAPSQHPVPKRTP